MEARDKARLLGLFFWLFTLFNIFVVAIIAVIYIALFGFVLSGAPQKAGDPPPELIMTIFVVVFAFVLVFTLLFSIPKVVAGYGLRNEKVVGEDMGDHRFDHGLFVVPVRYGNRRFWPCVSF